MSDYIKREDAIDAIDRTDWFHQAPNKNMVHGANSSEHQAWFKEQDVYAAIESIPAADVRPVVRAHWYWDKDGMDWGIGAWRCSACNTMSPMWWNTDKGSPMHRSGHSYCPICGAYMLEGEE